MRFHAPWSATRSDCDDDVEAAASTSTPKSLEDFGLVAGASVNTACHPRRFLNDAARLRSYRHASYGAQAEMNESVESDAVVIASADDGCDAVRPMDPERSSARDDRLIAEPQCQGLQTRRKQDRQKPLRKRDASRPATR